MMKCLPLVAIALIGCQSNAGAPPPQTVSATTDGVEARAEKIDRRMDWIPDCAKVGRMTFDRTGSHPRKPLRLYAKVFNGCDSDLHDSPIHATVSRLRFYSADGTVNPWYAKYLTVPNMSPGDTAIATLDLPGDVARIKFVKGALKGSELRLGESL